MKFLKKYLKGIEKEFQLTGYSKLSDVFYDFEEQFREGKDDLLDYEDKLLMAFIRYITFGDEEEYLSERTYHALDTIPECFDDVERDIEMITGEEAS